MKINLISATLLSFCAFAASAQSNEKVDDARQFQVNMDRFYSDPCYLSANCDNPPAAPTAPAVQQTRTQGRALAGGPLLSFRTFQPSYVAPATCTSLLGNADNAFLGILDTGTINPGTFTNLDLTFNGEARIQRVNNGTQKGIGAVGVRVLIDEIPAVGPTVQTELLFRWVVHSVIDSSLVIDVPNPGGVNQPIINSASVRRLVSLATGSAYRVQVLAKWSDVFTGMTFEPGPVNFVASGGARGAIVCLPTLSIVESPN
jgi:hypothetical protein